MRALVIDANPILSALLGGAARDVIFSGQFEFLAPQHTLFEVAKYLHRVATKINQDEADLFRAYQLMPIIACQPSEYEDHLDAATALIALRDPKDVHVLALALRLRLPIWTEDRDFEGIAQIKTFKTAKLFAELSTKGEI